MNEFGRHPKIARLAQDLGLRPQRNPLPQIRDYALNRVASFLEKFPAQSLDELLDVVAACLSVYVEYIKDDSDVDRIAKEQGAFFDCNLRALLQAEFLRGDTEGVVLQPDLIEVGDLKHLAVVDSRGDRKWRTYFTAWHELSHLLISPEGLPEPVRRTPSPSFRSKDPIEQVVDDIAGRVAFYMPIFEPILAGALAHAGELSLSTIEAVRIQAAPEASFFATTLAVMRLVQEGACVFQVELALKKEEQKLLSAPQLSLPGLTLPTPQPKLRVQRIIPDNSPKQLVKIFKNMRVPFRSIINQSYLQESDGIILTADEDLSWWETSRGGPLAPLPVRVSALRRGSYLYAMIRPLTDVSVALS